MDEGLSSGVSPDGGLELARTPRQSPPQVYTPRPDSWLPPRSGTYSSPKPPQKLKLTELLEIQPQMNE